MHIKFQYEDVTGMDHLEDVRIILKLVVDKEGVKLWTGFIWFGMRPLNTAMSLGFIKGEEFLDKLSGCLFLRKGYVPWSVLLCVLFMNFTVYGICLYRIASAAH
jgi:hypothetical protein